MRFAQPATRCQRCALRVPAGVAVCGACLQNPPSFDACIAAVDYAYPWADALAQFKFRGDPGWASALATLLRSTPWMEPALEAADRVLAVPLSTERLRERGFNQSAVLARQLAGAKADCHTLLRLHATEAQSGLPRVQRLRAPHPDVSQPLLQENRRDGRCGYLREGRDGVGGQGQVWAPQLEIADASCGVRGLRQGLMGVGWIAQDDKARLSRGIALIY